MKTANEKMILWGTPHSLYTGKVRSYLIKKGLPFRELLLANPRFMAQVMPTIRLMVAPVVELSDGTMIQDSTDILDAMEARYPDNAMVPTTPVQRCIALLIDAYGTEGMLAAAMHYRWSYRAEQEHFLCAEFGRAVHSGPDRQTRLAAGAKLMSYFSGFLPGLGVTSETAPAIEASYEALLDVLDIHFQHHPYLLGGRPSIADFGMMAPMFAHLGRDPVPSSLMKNRAPNVFRWTERMNLANIDDGEFPDCEPNYLPDDAIPETLEPVLALIFSDWGPQWLADAELFNRWIAENPNLPTGHVVGIEGERKVHSTLGMVSAPMRGRVVPRASAPHGLWLLEKSLACARSIQGASRQHLADLIGRNGGAQVMSMRLTRGMHRADNVLVLD
jgi:glutathione S-transferase